MIKLNLVAISEEQSIIKEFLEQNVSEVLANKINNGVKIVKDNNAVLNKKDLNHFLSYASQEAQKIALKGARSACIKDDVVFNWALHFFEEESLEGTLYNLDGSIFKHNKSLKSTEVSSNKKQNAPPTRVKPQISLFDLAIEDPNKLDELNKNNDLNNTIIDSENIDFNDEDFTTDEINELLEELSIEENRQNIDYETGEIIREFPEEHLVLQKIIDIFKDQNNFEVKI